MDLKSYSKRQDFKRSEITGSVSETLTQSVRISNVQIKKTGYDEQSCYVFFGLQQLAIREYLNSLHIGDTVANEGLAKTAHKAPNLKV